MKKSLMAAALLGGFASLAQAQTAVQIYGNVDVGVQKTSDQTLAIGKRAANTLGFKGTEDLGDGLKALFQLEIRYEPDTGTVENGARPLFQGQSRVGLQGDFGTVRLGRGLTPFQEVIGSFEPWHGLTSPIGFYTDISVAGFNTDPLAIGGTASNNRISNAIFYNSPVTNGFQVNASWASKEGSSSSPALNNAAVGGASYAAGAQGSANPVSFTATYNNGPAAAMIGYERNAVESKVWSIAGSFSVTPELKLMGTYTRQNQEHTNAQRPRITGELIGATYSVGPGKVLAGFGLKRQDENVRFHDLITRQYSLGYEYSLSKRTYVYVDASRKKNVVDIKTGNTTAPSVNRYDVGINHSF